GIGIHTCHVIVDIIAVSTGKEYTKIKSFVGESVGESGEKFGPWVTDEGLIFFSDHSVTVNIPVFYVTYPDTIRLINGKFIAVVINGKRAVLDFVDGFKNSFFNIS